MKIFSFFHSQAFCQSGMAYEMSVFSVNRHEELRLYKRVKQLEFLLARMTGNVNIRYIGIYDFSAFFKQLVDYV